MRGHDARNTNHSGNYGLKKGYRARYLLSGNRGVTGYVTAGPDGTIYTCAYDTVHFTWVGFLIAWNRAGSVLWAAPLVHSSGRGMAGIAPAVSPDGRVFVGWALTYEMPNPQPHALLAFDRDGTLLWRFEPNIPYQYAAYQSPVLGPDGTIYMGLDTLMTDAGTQRPSVFAINGVDGTVKWRFVVPRRHFYGGSPVLGRDGRLYIHTAGLSAADSGSIYCLDSATGQQRWELYDVGAGAAQLNVDEDGNFYAHYLGAEEWTAKFDPDGNMLWRYRIPFYHVNGTAAVAGGRLHLPLSYHGAGGRVEVLDLNTGQPVLHVADNRKIRSVVVDRAGNIYCAGDDRLAAYSRAGAPLWDVPWSQILDVVIGGDGWLVGSNGQISAVFESAVTLGDLNCDGSLNQFDIDPFIAALSELERYRATYPACDYETAADFNLDGTVNAFDIQGFIAALTP